MEIERLFIIEDKKELKRIERQLILLDFVLRTDAYQENDYFDYRDNRLYKDKKHFRFRYNSHYKMYNTIDHPILNKSIHLIIDDANERKNIERYTGEISLSKEWFDSKNNDVREQISIDIDDFALMEDLTEIIKEIGLIRTYNISKKRKEYGINTIDIKENFREKIHIEIDENIVVRYNDDQIDLEDTLQVCIETKNSSLANKEIQHIIKKLGINENSITTLGYFDRAKNKEV